MLRSVHEGGAIYDCQWVGETASQQPVVLVTNSLDPTSNYIKCALPITWEWLYRRETC
jgi:hypothetical protein